MIVRAFMLGIALCALTAPAVAAGKDMCWKDGRSSDKAEIVDLLGRYANAVNSQDPELYASVFTKDAVWEGVGMGTFVGIDAIRNAFVKNLSRNPHLTLNYTVDVNGTTATARSDVLVVRLEEPQPVVRTVAFYEDKLIRIGCAWKIQYRKFTRRPLTPAAK